MSGDSTAQFEDIAAAMAPRSSRLVPGFVAGSPYHPLPELDLAGIDSLEVGRGAETTSRRHERSMAVEVADRWVSTPHLHLRRNQGDWEIEDAGAKNGIFVNGERIQDSIELVDGDVIELGASFFVFREELTTPAPCLGAEGSQATPPATHNAHLRSVHRELAAIAESKLSILIQGETGTGKELAAELVHQASKRSGPLYPVNCAAIPLSIADAFLFGHKKGGFTGAVDDQPGAIRAADRGTLFLDEVAELDPQAQAKLLRVLQDPMVTPVGGTRSVRVDVRVVCATHADLDERVAEGHFRQDLLARLSGHRVTLPTLRHRREDLGLLVRELVERHFGSAGDQFLFDRAVLRALYAYEWPSNVRELEQTLHKAILSGGPTILLPQLPEHVRNATFGERPSFPDSAPTQAALQQKLAELLRMHRGNVSAVARDMNRARVQIRRWCKRFSLNPAEFRNP